MAVYRVEKNRNYTHMSNYHLRDKNLSNKACGLLSKMLSLPENWDYTTRGLAAICKDGVDSITSQLKELEQCGYLERRRIRDQSGKIIDMEYIIYEQPLQRSPNTESPNVENPCEDKQHKETPSQINKEITSKEKLNTNKLNIDSFYSDEHSSEPNTKRNEKFGRDINTYREIIKDNISYDDLINEMPLDKDRLEEVLELIVETVCSDRKYIRVAGTDYPAEVVRSRFMKLNMEHIRFVFECLKENTTKIRNIKQYLLTTLYNAPTTMGNYYSAMVQHDLYENNSHD